MRPDQRRRIDALIEDNLGLVRWLAGRYAGRGEPLEDLVQVGNVGLVKAAQRYDEGRGIPFRAYAIPMVTGELKRHFRDHCWSLHVPRSTKERAQIVSAEIQQELRRGRPAPAPAELAQRLALREREVVEALEAWTAFGALSLDGPASSDPGSEPTPLSELLGFEDGAYEGTEERLTLLASIRALGPFERQVVYMRCFENRNQTDIANRLGVSQMHVSRVLQRVLGQLGYTRRRRRGRRAVIGDGSPAAPRRLKSPEEGGHGSPAER